MSNELKPGTEEFAQRLTELTTMDLLFAYKKHEADFSKDSIAIAILTEAKRRDEERQRLATRITELEAQHAEDGMKLEIAWDRIERIREQLHDTNPRRFCKTSMLGMLERILEKLQDMPETYDDLGRHMYGDK